MGDMLTEAGAEARFNNRPMAFVLWFRPSTGRVAWEPVFHAETERECVGAIGIGGRRNGKWCILPHGKEP